MASGRGDGDALCQLRFPLDLAIDSQRHVFMADTGTQNDLTDHKPLQAPFVVDARILGVPQQRQRDLYWAAKSAWFLHGEVVTWWREDPLRMLIREKNTWIS